MNYQANAKRSILLSNIIKAISKNNRIASIRELTDEVNILLGKGEVNNLQDKGKEVSQSTINRMIKENSTRIIKRNGRFRIINNAESEVDFHLHQGLLLSHANAYTHGNPDFFTIVTKETTSTRYIAELVKKICEEEVVGYVLGENIIIFICGTSEDRTTATKKIDKLLGETWEREQEKSQKKLK